MNDASPPFEIFPWNDNFNTGISVIDQQHRKLVDILNRLARHFVSGEVSQTDMVEILDELADYAKYHFDTEEDIWHRHFSQHEMLRVHENAHREFFETINKIREGRGNVEEFIDGLFGFLTRWLASHILDNDRRMAIATIAADSGASLPEALERADRTMAGSMSVVIQAVLDMYSELSANTIELIKERVARNRTEEALKSAQSALLEAEYRASEQRFQMLFNTIPDSVFVVDAGSWLIVDCNATAEHLTQRPHHELIGMNVLQLHPEQEQSIHRGHLEKLVLGVSYDTIAATILQKSGQPRHVEISVRGPFQRGDQSCLVGIFRDVTRVKQHQAELEHIAYFDPLTGLRNRNGIKRVLESLLNEQTSTSVPVLLIHIDIDRFTQVNEKVGVDTADHVLQAFAHRLSAKVPDGTELCRLGGDEFMAVMRHPQSSPPVEETIKALLAGVKEPLDVDGSSLKMTASMGVTACERLECASAEAMIRQAAYALYQAKLKGPGQYMLFSRTQEDRVRQRNAQIEQVRQDLECGEFELFFQPKVQLGQGGVLGYEGLIRWHHPDKGLLAPRAFLPMIESDGIMIAVGDWVADSALRFLESGLACGDSAHVSINLTAMDLRAADFRAKTLPVDCLKLDKWFVDDIGKNPDDLAIVQAVSGICSAYGFELLAEGVETEAQGELLLTLGCDYVQGFYIAKPMPAKDVAAWFRNWVLPAAWMSPTR